MADGVGFEPTVRLHVRWFSRPVYRVLTHCLYWVNRHCWSVCWSVVAERVGFEPTVRLHVRWFSRPVL